MNCIKFKLQMDTDGGSGDPMSSYSTIFQCTEDGFTCTLRFLEGVISVVMFCVFLQGYRVMMKENNNPLTKEDKRLYMLAMGQTLILSFYYLLFEEFFILATIRNLLIWISINALEVLFRIYWIESDESFRKAKIGINVLKVLNFLTWFVIAVGDGSELVNSSFNLGYNCRLIDWIVLSGILCIITLTQAVISYLIIERLNWELQQPKTLADKNRSESINEEKVDIMTIVGGAVCGAIIMFIWDYIAYMSSTTDEMCEEIFSGNTFFRKVLCFLLKIISMQVVPTTMYYTIFHKRRGQFQPAQSEREMSGVDYFNDDFSELNRTLTERNNSRRSLFSGMGSTPNL